MSVLNKKPFIVSIIESLSKDQTTTLKGLINGTGAEPVFRTLRANSGRTMLSSADKGIKRAIIELNTIATQTLYTGYLIYTDDCCVLISYTNDITQKLVLLDMNFSNNVWSAQIKNCELSILELRSELDDALDIDSGSGAEILEVSSITTLTDDQINGLKAGDIVIKKTGNQKHTYTVSYKENNQGICLTYVDASISETVSYDYIGGHWVYNSTDVTELGGSDSLPDTTSASEGDVLKLNSNKEPVWGAGGGGTVVAYEGTSLLPTDVVFENWTLHRAIQEGNILWVVLSGVIKNTSGSAQYVQDFYSLDLPLDIQEKIYRLDGTTINNSWTSEAIVLRTMVINPSSSTPYSLVFKSESAGSFKVAFVGLANLGDNSSISIDVRIPLFLDIGTVAGE